ncbi:uncharacterized protein LOC135342797 [Halichondria panicea]|uniref:uncharacterized protein LOC135342797 n=1 Tax=Halichondria panicea TaxID=6063 RepID=UPI00312B7C98
METSQPNEDSQAAPNEVEEPPKHGEQAKVMNPLPSSQAAFLNSNIENIISAINDKRKRDISLLADFKSDLEMQCAAAYSLMESTIYSTYEQTNTVMEGKLQELLQVIERINLLESELTEFKSAFSALYSDIHA